jgi:hypothetical protein
MDPYRECQIRALDWVQNKAAKFSQCTGGSVWESFAQRRMTARFCALYKTYNGERAWRDIWDMLQAQYNLSRVDHIWKIRVRMIKTGIGKFSFLNRIIAEWISYLKGR